MIVSDHLAHDSIRHAFMTREGGVSGGIYAGLNCGFGSADDPSHVAENRARVAARMGVAPDALLSVHQIHSPDVVTVTTPWARGQNPKADAMVTDRPGIALGILTADCAPVLFHDADAGVIGAAHAGWKGAKGGVVEATVAAMQALGARPANIRATVGPTISQASYEVGPEFRDAFLGDGSGAEKYFIPSVNAGRFMFDLPAYVLDRLARSGVAATWSGHCTYADPARFFSFRRTTHRAEPDYGRMIATIAISDPVTVA